MMMERLTDVGVQEFSWNLMFADDIMICCKSKEQAEDKSRKVEHCSREHFMLVDKAPATK